MISMRERIKMNIADVLKNLPPLSDDYHPKGPQAGSDSEEDVIIEDAVTASIDSLDDAESSSDVVSEDQQINRGVFTCDMVGCDFQYKKFQDYMSHFHIKHYNELMACPKRNCNINVKATEMGQHLSKYHTSQFAQCPICAKFICRKNKPRHDRLCHPTPEDIDQYKKCPHDGCNKTFLSESTLRNHVRSVHCPNQICFINNCGKIIKRHNMSDHVRNVHDMVKFGCYKCGKALQGAPMKEHLKTCCGRDSLDTNFQFVSCD